jgi:hypothetical protein
MEIGFNIGQVHYHGTAVPFEKPGSSDTLFVVRLEDREVPVFHVSLSENGEWTSEDIDNPELVTSAGEQITKNNDGSVDIISNGEIINEPEDVEERSFPNA